MANTSLGAAKKVKDDEFYTRYEDIENEIVAYLMYNKDTFRGKVVYCNCDDPFESNFFQFFALNFERLGLKKLITTSYKGSPVAFVQTSLAGIGEEAPVVSPKGRSLKAAAYEINSVVDRNHDGQLNVDDIKYLLAHDKNATRELQGDSRYLAGDFRSEECVELLKKSDIVVTNPPFSLFREYMAQLVTYNKQFLILGNMNALKYKEIFPLIKANKIWLGVVSGSRTYIKPDKTEQKMGNTCWFTNLDHGRRHQPLKLMSMADNLKFNKKMINKTTYDHYDNYDAIDVPFTNAIPSDYEGIMGVPISFLDKYSPEQFEIIWQASGNTRASAPADVLKRLKYQRQPEDRGGCTLINNKRTYDRLFIKHRKVSK